MSYILDAVARVRARSPRPDGVVPPRFTRTPARSLLSQRTLWRMGPVGVLAVLVFALCMAWLDARRTARTTAASAVAATAPSVSQVGAAAGMDIPSMAPRPPRRASTSAAAPASTAARTRTASRTEARPAAAPAEPRSVARFSPPTTLSQPLPTPSPLGPGGAYAALGARGMAASPARLAAVPPAGPEPARPVALADLKPLSALPPDVRTSLARMKVRVLFYAPQPRSRFVMIDNRELREGDELVAGLRLEEITDTGLVMKHKDTLVLAPALAPR